MESLIRFFIFFIKISATLELKSKNTIEKLLKTCKKDYMLTSDN